MLIRLVRPTPWIELKPHLSRILQYRSLTVAIKTEVKFLRDGRFIHPKRVPKITIFLLAKNRSGLGRL